MFINLSFDASVSTTARAVVNSVAQFLQAQFSDPITININVVFGNTGLGKSNYNLDPYTYSQIKTALINDATSSDDVSAVSFLSATDPISGAHSWTMTPAEAKALGLISGSGTASDGTITFSNTAAFDYDRSNGITFNQYDFYGVVAHEMTEVMGRELNAIGNTVQFGPGYHPLDLFKYASATNHSFTGSQTGYFSVNNGFSDLNPIFNTRTDGDFGDWASSEAGDAFLAFSDPSVVNAITTADLVLLDAIGFTRTDDYTSTAATTGQVTVGSSTTGNVNYLRDHDWIRVQLTAGVQYTMDEQGQSVGAGTLSDPFMALYSTAGQLITSDDDSGGSRNSRIVYTPTTTGAYYIDAGAFDNEGTGTYRVSVSGGPLSGSVSINDVALTEGNSGSKVATFTVTRSGGTAPFAINFFTSDGGATTADNDYVANSGTLSFGTGVNTQTISVTINGDTKVESDEAFFVNLSGATNGATISDNLGIGTIINDDTAPAGSVSIDDVALTEGNSGSKVATFTVTRSGGTAPFAVNFFTSDGGATTADNDYVATSGTLNFGSGVNTQTISVTINGDTKVESDEAFFVNLSGATNGATISDNLGIGTIINDDTAPAGSVSINDVALTEGNSGSKVATFTVTRSGGTAAFAVNFFTSDGGATTADNDYVANSGTLNFGTGVNTQTISVTINGDTKFESDEAFFVNLSGATNGATISDNLGIGTIINDDAAPAGSVSINDVSITEGNSGTKVETFTVTRSGGTAAFAVNYFTSDGGATTADNDYVANSGTLNFGTGVNTQTISVTINGDTKFESDEAFFVNLSGATNGATISDNLGIGTIINDDAAPASVSINDVIVSEGDSGTKVATFTATRSGGTAAFDVNFTTADGTATVADHDYVANAGTLHFGAGVNTQTVSVTISGDTKLENSETFHVNLSDATNGAVIGDNSALGTIANDEGTWSPHEFNGDGKNDFLWRNDNGSVATWDMNDRSSSGAAIASVSNDWHIADTGDFNRDGRSDILWRNDGGAVATWNMNDRSYNGLVIGSASNDWHIAGTGDFNGDGMSDILWRNDSGAVATWNMNDRSPNGAVIGSASNDWHIAGTGDFNGDGKTDILWRNDSGAVATWDMNDRTPNGAVIANVSNDWHIAGTGDFNHDGKTDILWRNDSGAVATWDMNDRSSNGAVIATVSNDWHIAETGDFNGDHNTDILWRNDNGAVATWDMNDRSYSGLVIATTPNDWHII